MCSLSPFAMSFLVPAFPDIAAAFSKDVADVQLLISVFLIGLGVAQPVHGILADRYGRRPVLLTGFAIFLIASVASCFVTSWTMLVILRFLQAVGVSAGTVTSRAIVNDVQPREDAAVTLSYISIAMGLGPILAPIFGGIMNETLGWQSIFAGCAAAGFVIWFAAQIALPETRPANMRAPKSIKTLWRDYKALLTSPQFLGYTMMFGFGQGVFFAYLPFAPDYFENVLGQSTSVFVACWIALSLAFMTGSFLGTRLVRLYGMDSVIFGASIWMCLSLCVMALSYSEFGDNALWVTAAIMLAMLGTGMICPLALTGSISLDAKLAGTAAGLSSSLGLIIGGLFAVISGILYDGTLWPFIILAGIAIIGNFTGALMTRRMKRG